MLIDWSPWSFGCSEGSISTTVGLQKKLLHFKYSNADLPYTCVFRKNEFFFFLGKLQIYLSKYIPFWVLPVYPRRAVIIPIWVIEIYMHVLIMHASIKIWMKHQPHNCWLFGFTLCSSMDIIFNKMIHTHLQSIQNPVISSHFSGARNEHHELSIPSVNNICLV